MPELSMRKMASDRGGNSGNGNGNGNSQQARVQPLLPRQGSVYNLTLNEVQSRLDLSKPLSSMNLDELLKSVWSVEANQSTGSGFEGNLNIEQTNLHRQGSLVLTNTLSKKTVDDIWRDIQQSNISDGKHLHKRQPTLGEITLEEFLAKAGVVADSILEKVQNSDHLTNSPDPNTITPQYQPLVLNQWMPYTHPQFQRPSQNVLGVYVPNQLIPPPMTIIPNNVMDISFPDHQRTLLSPVIGMYSDSQTLSRKRNSSVEVVEKTVDTRHKRMIKNRESAARSRSRKQAYTNELESKVSRLEEENERLRRKKKLESFLSSAPPSKPKYQLRRTSSSPL